MQFLTEILPNGLEVIAECNDEAVSTALGFFVETGARDETDEVSGVSHFLEHMVFKGTPKRSADDVNREFDEMGAHYNAFTSEESTVYYAAVLPEYQDRIVDLWADVLRPALREEDFTTEKNVILEEIQMYDDQPPYGAHEKCMALHYQKHPLARSVLGTTDSITMLPVDAMRAYFKQRYSPRNITLAAAGRVDFDALVSAAERYCGLWEPFEPGRETPTAPPGGGFQVIQKASSTQEYIMQLANGPSGTDPDRYAAKVLATVLGDDSGSRMYWALVDPGKAEHASLHHSDYHGVGLYMTYLCCDPDYAAQNLQAVLEIYRQAQEKGITQAELDQAKSKINSRVVLGSERPRGRLFTIGSNWTQRREYRTVKDDLEAVEALTLADLHNVLARWPLTQCTTVAIGPLGELAQPR